MKLHDYWAGLLADTVNLDQESLDLLDGRVASIVSAVKADAHLGPLYVDHIPQGSWPQRTIIRPLPGDEFDADFLLHLVEQPGWEPKDYLKQTRAAFKRSFVYRNMVRKKNRCVRIGYVGSCHVDVVPHLVLTDGRQVIVNYAENAFEDTNPAGFTEWMRERDGAANSHLRRVIRLLKYLRDYKNTFSVPSVILTTLIGERVDDDDPDAYPDPPTAFVRLLGDLDDWLALHPTMPTIADPSCPGTTFDHRWDQDRYANFARWVGHYRRKADLAFAEPDRDRSVALWRDIFGEAFAKSDTVQAAAEQARVAGTQVAKKGYVRPATAPAVRAARPQDGADPSPTLRASPVRAPGEQFVDELFVFAPRFDARIDATLSKARGFRDGLPLRRLRRAPKDAKVHFSFRTECPLPYELWWKVRNHGPEAAARGQLRGQIRRDGGDRRWRETTSYRGEHYVDAYAVVDGVVVAWARHDVPID